MAPGQRRQGRQGRKQVPETPRGVLERKGGDEGRDKVRSEGRNKDAGVRRGVGGWPESGSRRHPEAGVGGGVKECLHTPGDRVGRGLWPCVSLLLVKLLELAGLGARRPGRRGTCRSGAVASEGREIDTARDRVGRGLSGSSPREQRVEATLFSGLSEGVSEGVRRHEAEGGRDATDATDPGRRRASLATETATDETPVRTHSHHRGERREKPCSVVGVWVAGARASASQRRVTRAGDTQTATATTADPRSRFKGKG
jgi:hypothetical protein